MSKDTEIRENLEQAIIEFMSSLVETFKKMSKADQEEFLKLDNRFAGDEELNRYVKL